MENNNTKVPVEITRITDPVARYETCKSCDHFFKPSRQCKECMCFMNIKTKVKDATCPLGKW